MRINLAICILSLACLPIPVSANTCSDPQDTFDKYNDVVPQKNDIPSEYYVMSYSWAPAHCAKSGIKNGPGDKDYLQCGSGRNFGYILHGLWPQGYLNGSGGYPRSCEGDQPKIKRSALEPFLCMTPSVWLLQHEYEYHGTCMHDETLETPEMYFRTALKLHKQLVLPKKQLKYEKSSIKWFTENNPSLPEESIQYYEGGREWQFCYDNNFEYMPCPNRNKPPASNNHSSDASCVIKGNINRNGFKYYFTKEHINYDRVKIDRTKGERCFDSVEKAVQAGWRKAPK